MPKDVDIEVKNDEDVSGALDAVTDDLMDADLALEEKDYNEVLQLVQSSYETLGTVLAYLKEKADE